jgi:hypothetical protein
VLHFVYSFVWRRKFGISESRSNIFGKLRNVVLENDEDHWTVRVRKGDLIFRVKEERITLRAMKEGTLTGLSHLA